VLGLLSDVGLVIVLAQCRLECCELQGRDVLPGNGPWLGMGCFLIFVASCNLGSLFREVQAQVV